MPSLGLIDGHSVLEGCKLHVTGSLAAVLSLATGRLRGMPAKKTGSDSAKAKQRPISAFFFQKATNPDSTANGNGQVHQQKTQQQSGKQQQQQQQQHTDDSPDVEVVEQPAKRARYFQSDQAAAPQQQEPSSKPSSSAPDAQQPTRTEPAGSASQHPPPRPGSHQRFQNKLVLGIGNRKAAGRDSNRAAEAHALGAAGGAAQEAACRGAACSRGQPHAHAVDDAMQSTPAGRSDAAWVQVGYKFRFFGEDAEVASRVSLACCHQSHAREFQGSWRWLMQPAGVVCRSATSSAIRTATS